jgi:hypothetical protein
MKIFNLTRGKYPNVYFPQDDLYYVERMEQMSHLSFEFMSVFASSNIDVSKLLNDVPVFLVESSMANEYMAVPECHCSVCVPADKSYSLIDDFDIDNWANSKEGYKDDPRERISKGLSIEDLLGVYIYSGDNDLIPRRVFIWMDKILDYAKKNTKNKGEIIENARALFDLVLYHEMAHALMDVELYGVHPAPNFSYANDYPYRFIEEAYANGIALTILLNTNSFHVSSAQKSFIEAFVKKQGEGYSEGWELFRYRVDNINQFIGLKVLFNYEFARLLRDWWKDKRFHDLVCYKGVGHREWIAVRYYHDKWGIIEIPNQKAVTGFKKYDSFWSFDENGLCMVRLDQEHGYLYGYVNEQGVEQIPVEYDHLYCFENGITVAKKEGFYGAIDLNNQIVIPFNLPYEDVRAFRNGRAAVKNSAGKWGLIDTTGKEIVPCTSDVILL